MDLALPQSDTELRGTPLWVRELGQTNFALAICVADTHGWDWHDCRRREICGHLGFPATESVVHILAKIVPQACSPTWLRALGAKLESGALRRVLSHLPEIDFAAVFMGVNWAWDEGVSLPLFKEMCAQSQGRQMPISARTLDDTLAMLERFGLPYPRFGSIEALERCHDRLVRRWLAEERGRRQAAAPFPGPPVNGSDEIVPIRTAEELWQEGREQRHCVAMLEEAIAGRRAFVYRVMRPERATLSVREEAGKWRLGELRAYGNAPAQQATELAVRAWWQSAGGVAT